MGGAATYKKNPTDYYCFVAGTFIVTMLGLTSIENIQVGDYVYAKNEITGGQAYMPVLEIYERKVTETYTIPIAGESIETTDEHPFFTVDNGWTCAKDLEAGDTVELSDGTSASVDSVEKNELDEPVTVYNFNVMDYHTYYVGESGVLVHNACTKSKVDVDSDSILLKSNTQSRKYQVGAYQDIKGAEGLDAHHVGQKSIMKRLVDNYDPKTAPAINVPKVGHTISGPNGIVSRSANGIKNARQLLARDLFELKRVYPDIPNSAYKELIDMNMRMYPEMRK